MTRAKEAEQPQANWDGVPNRKLPHVSSRIRMRSRFGTCISKNACKKSQRRRGDWRRIDTHPVCGRSGLWGIDGAFKQPVMPLSSESIHRVSNGKVGQEVNGHC